MNYRVRTRDREWGERERKREGDICQKRVKRKVKVFMKRRSIDIDRGKGGKKRASSLD